MQRLKCDINRRMIQIASHVLLRRSLVTRPGNFYEVLGVSRVATQAEIKGAYYKLSMVFHPDKNKNNEEAAEKFRQITAAYEVLGNFRLKKLYDKGMLNTAGEKYQNHEPPPEEDDATTRFYKARMKKEHRTATGRTPIYDFDEWTEQHYGSERNRKQTIKSSTNTKSDRKSREVNESKREFMVLITVIIFLVFSLSGKNFDVDKVSEKKKSEKPDKN